MKKLIFILFLTKKKLERKEGRNAFIKYGKIANYLKKKNTENTRGKTGLEREKH